jgi:hypothetical protein
MQAGPAKEAGPDAQARQHKSGGPRNED